ncbi:hypothetical protein HanPSC8_Chr01g0033071 [Helianthus annuus]|nr:hypothetical protein HanPSC8_Chr01g0033071 [Helianthus annuus]
MPHILLLKPDSMVSVNKPLFMAAWDHHFHFQRYKITNSIFNIIIIIHHQWRWSHWSYPSVTDPPVSPLYYPAGIYHQDSTRILDKNTRATNSYKTIRVTLAYGAHQS